MKVGSVCSGIGAPEVAWMPLGWQFVWSAEFDKAASAVLDYRFPGVPNLGDMTTIAAKVLAREVEAPDVLVGGTPCQSFSVAGLRGGMSDARGQLTLAYVQLANAIDEIRIADGKPPVIIVWENVPGVLNHKENPFGCFLAGVAGESDVLQPPGRKWTNAGIVSGPQRAAAWRVLDAQYFGLAQRRRRVFAVASARQGFDPGAVLLEFEGVRRDTAPRREAGETVTHPVAPCLTSSGRGVERTGDTRGQDPVVAVDDGRIPELGMQGLRRGMAGQVCDESRERGFAVSSGMSEMRERSGERLDRSGRIRRSAGGVVGTSTGDIAHCLNAGGMGRQDYETETMVVHAIQERAVCENPNAGPDGKGWRDDGCAYTLEVRTVPQAIAFSAKDYGADATTELSPTLRAGGHTGSHQNGGVMPAVCITGEDGTGRGQPIVVHGTQDPCTGEIAFALGRNNGGENVILPGARSVSLRGRDGGATAELGDEVAGCLRASGGGDKPHVLTSAVRRLLPIECERLQGFPDDWTRIPVKLYPKKTVTKTRPEHMWERDPDGNGWWLMSADGPRYKQLGNSMAVPVMAWIGERIAGELEFDHLL